MADRHRVQAERLAGWRDGLATADRRRALAVYRASSGVRWTYISPPPGLAVAIVDEIERPQFICKRFTAGY